MKDQESVEIKKHSAIIAMSNRNLSIASRKLFNAILFLAGKMQQSDPDMEIFRIRFSDIKKIAGYSNYSNIKYLKECIRELVDTTVEYNMTQKDNKNLWGIFSILAQATILTDDRFVTVGFAPIVRNNLSYPSMYALLNTGIINSLNNIYSLPLYELAADYKKVGKFIIEIKKFRELVGVDENKYTRIDNFKSKVVEKAIEEINQKTDLFLTFELLQHGIDIEYTHIAITIKDKYAELDEVETSAYLLLKSKGLSDNMAKRFSKQLSKQSIVESVGNLERAIKKGGVESVQAYLTKILKGIEIEGEDENCEILHNSKTSAPVQLSDYKPLAPTNIVESKQFKDFTKNRINEIIQTLSFDAIEEFVATQNDFGVNYLIGLGLIDENKEIINLKLLKENFLFLGFVESKYFDRDNEFKIYSENK